MTYTCKQQRRTVRRGQIFVVVCLGLFILLAMTALSVDVAFMHLTRTQLRKVADASARAASGELAVSQDIAAARQKAKDVANLNNFNGAPYILSDSEIFFGRSQNDGSGWTFTPNNVTPNAVRILAKPPQGVGLFFGRVVGLGDFSPEQSAVAAGETRDICLVLDRSGSMAWDLSEASGSYPPYHSQCTAPDSLFSRWGALQDSVGLFVNEVDQTAQLELVGLVTYSSDYTTSNCGGLTVAASRIEHFLSNDFVTLINRLDQIGDSAIVGATNIAAGIDQGVVVVTDPALSRRFAEKMIVLLTDGIENNGRDSRDAARDARDQRVTIHTITFSSGADVSRMEEVATITGGEHLHAPDWVALRQAFLRIARGIPSVLID